MMRNPNQIAFRNGTLADALELHRKWPASEEGGNRLVVPVDFNLSKANLSWSNLSEANLSGANLSGADLSGADLSKADLSKANLSDVKSMSDTIGNRNKIKGMQIERYTVTYDAVYLQIGCQRHIIERWREFSDAQIRAMDGEDALAWWAKWKPVIFQIIEMSPANPTGYVEKEGE